MKKTSLRLLLLAAALQLTPMAGAVTYDISGYSYVKIGIAGQDLGITSNTDDIISNGGNKTYLEVDGDVTIGGISGNGSGQQITSPFNLPGFPKIVTLTIDVAEGKSYNYSGMWRPNNWDGSNVTVLDIIKNGKGTQEFSGWTTGYNTSPSYTGKLTVNEGTFIVSGSIFSDDSSIMYATTGNGNRYARNGPLITLNGGILEIQRDWSAGSGKALSYSLSALDPAAILINGGSIKFSKVNQNSYRGFTIGSNGGGIITDVDYTKPLTQYASNITNWINGSNGGSITLSGSGNGTLAETLGVYGTWQNSAALIKTGTGAWSVGGVNLKGGITVNSGILTITGNSTTAGDVIVTGGVLTGQSSVSLGTGQVKISGGQVNVAGGFANDVILSGGTLNLGGNSSSSKITLNGGSILGGQNYTGNAIITGNLDAGSNLKGNIDLQSGSSLFGNGTIGKVNLGANASLAPGNSIGIINMDSLTIQGGSTLSLEVQNPLGNAGVGYDLLNVVGQLDLSNLSKAKPSTIKLISLNQAGQKGDLQNIINGKLNIVLIDYGSINLGSNVNLSDLFTLDLSGFTANGGPGATGRLYLDNTNGALMAELSPIPEPSTYGMMIGGLSALAGLARRRQRKQEALAVA